jgi:hypothetical protein
LNAPPPPGSVRIDPELLARAMADQDDDPDKPPALPRNTRAGSDSTQSDTTSSNDGAGQSSAIGDVQPGPTSIGVPQIGITKNAQKGNVRPKPPASKPWRPKITHQIEVPLDLVVACGPNGVVLHPGGYRLSRSALGKDGVLRRDLETIVQNHELIDPGVRPRPRLQFLVERGGNDTYREARRQTVLAGLPWPVTHQVAGPPAPQVFGKERF